MEKQPRYSKNRKSVRKIKKKYITKFLKENRQDIVNRNNELFRTAKKLKKEQERG